MLLRIVMCLRSRVRLQMLPQGQKDKYRCLSCRLPNEMWPQLCPLHPGGIAAQCQVLLRQSVYLRRQVLFSMLHLREEQHRRLLSCWRLLPKMLSGQEQEEKNLFDCPHDRLCPCFIAAVKPAR
jgi:hypothetical protein